MSPRQIELTTKNVADQADAARWRWFRANCTLVSAPPYGSEFRIADTGPGIDVDSDTLEEVPAYLDALADAQIAEDSA